jgi:hypothetical protein
MTKEKKQRIKNNLMSISIIKLDSEIKAVGLGIDHSNSVMIIINAGG